jgi:transposase InsO family protein
VRAVLALFGGASVAHVAAQFGISRSALYKFRRRALTALRQALEDHPRGPKQPHNRLGAESAQQVVSICERYPTWSSYQVHDRLGTEAPSTRTIQRIRKRRGLTRLPKRAPPSAPVRRLSPEVMERAAQLIHDKPHLGPERIAWDLHNAEHVQISPSTVKRLKKTIHEAMYPLPPPAAWRFYERRHPHSLWHGDFMEKVTLTDLDQTAYQLTLLDDYSRGYLFCKLFLNPDMRTTVRALIAAIRQWRVIPKAILFDNGPSFKGKLITAFCKNLGVRLIHSAVNHPQTNGKLERAFRDDMRDFYQQYDAWLLEPLRKELPGYVHYRNHIRGHRALGGKPSITRLHEHQRLASPDLLARLETYVYYEAERKIVSPQGTIRLFGRDAYVGRAFARTEMVFFETLEGLEARVDGQCVAILRDYRTFRQLPSWERDKLPRVLYFAPCERAICPRNAVA